MHAWDANLGGLHVCMLQARRITFCSTAPNARNPHADGSPDGLGLHEEVMDLLRINSRYSGFLARVS